VVRRWCSLLRPPRRCRDSCSRIRAALGAALVAWPRPPSRPGVGRSRGRGAAAAVAMGLRSPPLRCAARCSRRAWPPRAPPPGTPRATRRWAALALRAGEERRTEARYERRPQGVDRRRGLRALLSLVRAGQAPVVDGPRTRAAGARVRGRRALQALVQAPPEAGCYLARLGHGAREHDRFSGQVWLPPRCRRPWQRMRASARRPFRHGRGRGPAASVAAPAGPAGAGDRGVAMWRDHPGRE
jgi:hypothetical protein